MRRSHTVKISKVGHFQEEHEHGIAVAGRRCYFDELPLVITFWGRGKFTIQLGKMSSEKWKPTTINHTGQKGVA